MPDKKPAEPEANEILDARQTAPEVPGKLRKQLPADKSNRSDEKSDEASTAAPAEDEPLADRATDKAVDAIVAQEGDIVLAVEDAAADRRNQALGQPADGWKAKLRRLLRNKWTWISIVVVLIALFAVPVTRYKILGLVVKKSVTLTIIDSKTKTPVSNAQVSLGGAKAKTDANGRAKLRVSVGKDQLTISKQYYQTASSSYFVGFKSATSAKLPLTATGRLVPITVINKITGQPLKGAEIQVLKTTAKTDAKGLATVALPADNTKDAATLKLAGYNTSKVSIEVTDQKTKANSFELTPTGHMYFLSNLNGSLDVVKANLDGSDRHTVLEGTGKEDKASTSLLASRDWRYLVLKARRDSDQAALYLIDTATDKVTQFDNGNADFQLIGWYGHSFIYDLTRNSVSNWQSSREVLKSYDAEHLQLNQLDQSQAEGDANTYAQQSFGNFYLVNGAVTYTTQWYGFQSGYGSYDLSGKNNTIRAISPTGQNKKDYQSFTAGGTNFSRAALYEPQAIYYSVYDNADGKTRFYEYEDQAVKLATGVDQNSFNQGYPTYLLSPSGSQVFWTELRDGKNTLFTGDTDAKSPKKIASLSDYAPYGWYSDSYALVSKNSSELYIMPATGNGTGTTARSPLKITDYYKPAQTFTGYGYGYGGL